MKRTLAFLLLSASFVFGQNDTLDNPQTKRTPASSAATNVLVTDGDPSVATDYREIKTVGPGTAGQVLTSNGTTVAFADLPAATPETVTTLVDNGNGTYTYTSEDATTTVVNTTADTNPYDPTGTGLVSTTSGDAIDELSLKLRPFQISGSPQSATNGSSVSGTSVIFRTGDVILGADSRSSGNPQFEVVGSIVGGSNNHTVTDTGNNLVVGNTLTATGLQNIVGGDSNQALGNRGLIAGGLGNVAQAGARDYAIIGSQNVNYSGGIGVVHVASDRNISNTGSLFHLMTGRTNTINSGAGLGITTGVSNIENGARNILGGLSNTSSGFSSILVGNQNVNSGSNNIITGFNNNSNSTSSNILISGRDNVLQNTQSSIIAGQNHNIDGQSNSLIIGSALTATAAAGSRNLYVGNNGSISVSSNDSVLLGEGGTLDHSNAFLFSTTSGASQADDSFTAQAQGGIWMFSNSASTTGMTIAPGASSWAAVSLREKKKNIKPYDKGALDKVNNLGLYTYEYKESNIRNSGPMFDGKDGWKEVVGLSPGENLISDKDISVLALAAIQEMSKEIEDLKAQLNSKK